MTDINSPSLITGSPEIDYNINSKSNNATVVCISLETPIHYLAVVSTFVKIKKLLIYGLKDLKICHKFQH